ncbi:hypothetical protein [Geminicoccus flavidas]|uniref:hypothetical protein n=1 Tax=Geminicoccus flavidas TaxID=2506407 RepID=UPI001358C47B|nr:hypothetical protein [Geminicoccus flavidas]
MPSLSFDPPPLMPAELADPSGLLRAALAHDQGHPPREILLAWLMSLAPGTDPARAARAMLPDRADVPGSIGAELAEVARWPAERLAGYARRPRR